MKLLSISNLILLLSISNSFASSQFVTDRNVFSGEAAINLTSGAPVSVSSTGKITTGITNVENSFSSTITTTSATDVVLTGMTSTPASGTYLVVYSHWITHSTGNATVTISIYAGGVQSAATVRTTLPFTGAVGGANNGMEEGTNGIVTVNGAQAIAIEWHTSTGTATTHAGTMDLVRLQ